MDWENKNKQQWHMRVDAHQHFWKYSPETHDWINDEMKVIRKDFGPTELGAILQANNINGCVAIQADETEKETSFLLEIADKHPFVKSVVGWMDLLVDDPAERLHHWKKYKKLAGFRAIMQGQEDSKYLTNSLFQKNVQLLVAADLTYDLLVFHDQFPSLIRFVEKLPDNRMILDHIGKPDIKNKQIKQWKDNIRILAQHPGIYCKLSGMITEADFKHWTYEDLKPYMEIAAEYFGIDRICFGTDWPVCLVAGTYTEVVSIMHKFSEQLNTSEKEKLMGGNTIKFYKIQ